MNSPRSEETTWARVEDGFYVGSLGGEFFGYIDREAEGRYVAYDSHSRSVGRFSTRAGAVEELNRLTAPSLSAPEGE
ncbi:hypothetical protein J4H92_12235 [Leucobacter weissii]|uniref:Uncharacterized protein n=1 Tax=Leucobacter weissii TaxID=1983706 RepID=A0A939MMQ7_9MICO|nr:hypothetical protein [Leucobacter weissii]MBO1902715.1 hypothetical protein [Leucobacter weissii]